MKVFFVDKMAGCSKIYRIVPNEAGRYVHRDECGLRMDLSADQVRYFAGEEPDCYSQIVIIEDDNDA